jgi:PTS system mannose-specific IIA component
MRPAIKEAIAAVDEGDGVMVLTDMFGGTPSNLSLSFLSGGEVEVLTGVNLPMIIKLVQSREKMNLSDLAHSIGEYGRKSISVAGEVLGKRRKS